ncbi:hypothetical protein [Aquimarina sp. RZ0]|uniref:hypothetical protein n=1 Tax=Aquimarina sp. RZ0 TaxID=2607730 RepID=UPI0011F2384B|nr:hypothetical protein [Aquimarina sp. RZ0]KAA1243924.1 hypothetical protein F0000_18860 [Aquimarina sp. RZ0]
MTAAKSISLFTAINLVIVGVFYMLQPKIWVALFASLYSKKYISNTIKTLITLGMDSLIFSFHLLRKWFKILITIYGMVPIIKVFIYKAFTALEISGIDKLAIKKEYMFRRVGILMFRFLIVVLLVNSCSKKQDSHVYNTEAERKSLLYDLRIKISHLMTFFFYYIFFIK